MAGCPVFNDVAIHRKGVAIVVRIRHCNQRTDPVRMAPGVRYRGKQIFWSKVENTIPDPANPARAIDAPTTDAYTPAYTPDD